MLEKGMCAGLLRWAKIRVHLGDEIVDYDANVRNQLETRAIRLSQVMMSMLLALGLPDV
jgi:hypothetical protein